jgi:hypothetical protein
MQLRKNGGGFVAVCHVGVLMLVEVWSILPTDVYCRKRFLGPSVGTMFSDVDHGILDD